MRFIQRENSLSDSVVFAGIVANGLNKDIAAKAGKMYYSSLNEQTAISVGAHNSRKIMDVKCGFSLDDVIYLYSGVIDLKQINPTKNSYPGNLEE